jgi:hypothetical protein
MKRRRRLRKLEADGDLLRRRAAGEPLRQLAADYDVVHTTLCRYFARPEVKEQLKKVVSQPRAEQRELAARRAVERRLERQVRRRAEERAAAEAERARRYRAQFAAWSSGRRARGSGLAAWLDERDAPWLPPTRADRHSTYDKEAEQVVAAGGGTQALLAATELPTLEVAAGSIDPELLAQAFDNDALERAQPQPLALTGRPRLRRLVPDTQLLRRRAAGSRCGCSPLSTTSPTRPSPASSPDRRSNGSCAKPCRSFAPNGERVPYAAARRQPEPRWRPHARRRGVGAQRPHQDAAEADRTGRPSSKALSSIPRNATPT